MELTATLSAAELVWVAVSIIGLGYAGRWTANAYVDRLEARRGGNLPRILAAEILLAIGYASGLIFLADLGAGLASAMVPPSTGTVTWQSVLTAVLLVLGQLALVAALDRITRVHNRLVALGLARSREH